MAVKIRLARYGAKKNPFYRVVVANVSAPRDGRFLEIVGTYNPMVDPAKIEFKREKIIEWIKKGAKPTNTVQKLSYVLFCLRGNPQLISPLKRASLISSGSIPRIEALSNA